MWPINLPASCYIPASLGQRWLWTLLLVWWDAFRWDAFRWVPLAWGSSAARLTVSKENTAASDWLVLSSFCCQRIVSAVIWMGSKDMQYLSVSPCVVIKWSYIPSPIVLEGPNIIDERINPLHLSHYRKSTYRFLSHCSIGIAEPCLTLVSVSLMSLLSVWWDRNDERDAMMGHSILSNFTQLWVYQ